MKGCLNCFLSQDLKVLIFFIVDEEVCLVVVGFVFGGVSGWC